jgi:hypothetical protein
MPRKQKRRGRPPITAEPMVQFSQRWYRFQVDEVERLAAELTAKHPLGRPVDRSDVFRMLVDEALEARAKARRC